MGRARKNVHLPITTKNLKHHHSRTDIVLRQITPRFDIMSITRSCSVNKEGMTGPRLCWTVITVIKLLHCWCLDNNHLPSVANIYIYIYHLISFSTLSLPPTWWWVKLGFPYRLVENLSNSFETSMKHNCKMFSLSDVMQQERCFLQSC